MVFPTEIDYAKSKGQVRITWEDGHVGVYDEVYLRGYCPCALCQGHGAQRRFVDAPGAKLLEIRTVGNYAVELRWQDGHSTGIYTFEYLRSLCPCSECAIRSAEKEKKNCEGCPSAARSRGNVRPANLNLGDFRSHPRRSIQ